MSILSKSDKLSLIEIEATGTEFFRGKHINYNLGKIPFFISSDEFVLSSQEVVDFNNLGVAIAELFKVLSEMRGDNPDYFFFRPDIILTEDGYKVCEIELSPFGFPLAVFLEDAYNAIRKAEGKEFWSQNVLSKFIDFWNNKTGGKSGQFVFSSHTKSFFGQFEFLSKKLNDLGCNFESSTIKKLKSSSLLSPFYRCFYLYEKYAPKFLDNRNNIFPSSTSFYETKLPLVSLANDQKIRSELSEKSRNILDSMVLPTWLIKDDVLDKSFPLEIKSWYELADLSQKNRKFVIKRVGNHHDSSWGKSVIFLHKISGLATRRLIETTLSQPGQWIVQPFINSKKVTQNYFSPSDKKWIDMKGRVRLTPYFSFDKGEWLVGKATIRRNTLLVHGATDSINTLITW